jgi:ubiquinone/menaquinone biosynthesis C-methylase UbiE
MGASATAASTFDRCLNWNHDGIADLSAQLSRAADVDRQELERAIVRAAERLVWRMDLDPLLKHDFLLLHDAARLYGRTFGDRCDEAIEALCDQCFATYRAVRQAALESADAFDDLPIAPALTEYEDLARLGRFERLRAQATLIRRNAHDMACAYEFLLDALPRTAARMLNVGDGVPLGQSFLRRIVARMHETGARAQIVTIDLSPGLHALQREAVVELARSACTLAFHRMDACATWFADATFDCAVGSFMFDDCGDQPGLLRELHRVVKLGGVVALSGHHLSTESPADRFVHNYSDFHAVSGHPVRLPDVVRLVDAAPLDIRDRFENPHAWVVALTPAPTACTPSA